MTVNFRKAIQSDYNTISKLKIQAHNFHHNNRPDFYKYSELPINKKEYKELLNKKDNYIYVVESDNKICGYAIIKVISFRDNPLIVNHKRFFIDDLYIDQSYRNKGIGKFLMKELESICKSNGFKYIDLNVWNFNSEAIDFFKRIGMKDIMIRMEKTID